MFANHSQIASFFIALTFSAHLCAQPARETIELPGDIRTIDVIPSEIRVGGFNRRQQVLVTGKTLDGRTFDLTHRVELATTDAKVATIRAATILGKRDGVTSLQIRFRDLQKTVPVVVESLDEFPRTHFVNDVMPILSKLGCNSGGCHGKQSGQNGFKLSVFGFDPRADFNALVKEGRGRRVFPAAPNRSLLVTKPAGIVPHGGGQRLDVDSVDFELLRNWIEQGTPWGADDAATLESVRIEPTDRVLPMNGEQQVLVTAIFSDGSQRDVTAAAAYTTNTEVIATVDQNGRIQVGRVPGEAAITVNYMGHVGAVRVIVPRPTEMKPYPKTPTNNRIDELVWAKLEKLNISPSEICDDATFLRRLHLTAIGTLPTPDEVREFLADPKGEKRNHAIERVLKRPEFADYWSLRFADVLLINRNQLGERGAYEFHRWLRSQFAQNRPYDEWVRELITASGNSGKNGPVNFYRALDKPEDLAKAVSQAFLGVRIDCAQCHHHPFDRWGQEDFYGLSGFFNGIKRKKLGSDRELIFHSGFQPTTMPLSGELVATRPLGDEPTKGLEDGDPRVKLAGWLTAKENPWFARLVANRLWKHFLGRGLIEPEDDLRSTNPATNEALLKHLEKQIVESNFNIKSVMRQIMQSRVFQLSAKPNVSNQDDEQNFSHYLIRRLPAEVLLDAISAATGSPEQFAGMPPGTRSIELWDNRLPSYFLDTFGRSERESPCECGKSGEPTMSQALHLMNAPEIEEKIARNTGRIAKLIENRTAKDRIVDELCLATLGRHAREKERNVATRLFDSQPPRQAAEDFMWTLLNSYEFLFIR